MSPDRTMTEVSLEVKQRIDLVCDEFKKARRASQDARIEDYLAQFSRRGREALFYELLRIEIAVWADLGQRPDPEPYYERFPQFRSIIDSVFTATISTQHASHSPGGARNGGPSSQFESGDQITGYAVVRKLGEGSFGVVYLARDLTLGRRVALKVARRDAFESTDDVARFRTEAQNAARITHPGVVTIYSVVLDHDPPFIVEEYVEGKDLKAVLQAEPPSLVSAVELVANLAETIAHAHQQGVYHRDLKPANILITADGRARIVDFGLALQEDERRQSRWERCGTPLYMAPEQVRGESHRLDGRCDIWSLGAILYELVVGQRPFEGTTREELYEEILHKDVRPPRQLKPQLPVELERICLKCLAKRTSDRYTTAVDLAADLRELLADWEAHTAADPLPAFSRTAAAPVAGRPKRRAEEHVTIVPKGLRAFDEHDADFFLELVPGPCDRHGLPEAVRFWKHRIEETDAAATFPVGVIYGPSGCGKSSLVRAGLLPRLSEHVIALYVEAGQDETSTTRLVNQLYKQFPALPPGLDLHDAITELRTGAIRPANTKLLLVLDQFEQWLHSTAGAETSSLVQALRQCDGGRIQALILVRDDFWLAVSRFMRELEVRIIEGENSALVDLFDPDHALKVLAAFGRAYGRLPADPENNITEQRAFLSQAIDALVEDGKVNCVRLALLAEMMKGKPWTPANLKRMGGVEGVGVAFLEDRFSSSTAPPKCRLHQHAARAVLGRLLPEPGANIRGHRRNYSDLLQVSGNTTARDFEELLQILDSETRLITPSDSGAAAPGSPGDDRHTGEKCYQLTHDYLVPSLREWLTQKKRETRRGRAELRLADRAELWNARREKNQLPSWWETLCIACLTARRDWTAGQQRMMKAATRLHLRRLSTLMLVICTVGAAGFVAWSRLSLHDRQQEADYFVAQVLVSDVERFESLLEQTPGEHALWRDRLQTIADDALRDTGERMRAHLVLVRHDAASVPYLVQQLQQANLRHAMQIQSALGLWPAEALPRAWAAIEMPNRSDSALLRLGACLAQHDPDSDRWSKVADKVAGALVTSNQLEVGEWMTALEPAKRWLLDPLGAQLRDTKTASSRRTMAAEILAQFGSDSPDELAAWIIDAGPEQFSALLDSLKRHRPIAATLLAERLQSAPQPTEFEALEKQMRAAVALLLVGEADQVWPLLRQSAEPGLRTSLISSLSDYGVPPDVLVRELLGPHPASVRSALLLSLGKYEFDGSQPLFGEAAATVSQIYQHDSDGGVHSAAEWLLTAWGAELPELPRTAPPGQPDRQWWVNSEGHTMIAQRGPVEFTMGSPVTEIGRDDIESQYPEVINRSFAMGAHEVTIAQFLRFKSNFQYAPEIGIDPQCPVNRASWFDAMRYCRWLSEREGIAEDQMCYPPLEQIGPEIELPDDLLSRTGYRLPTEAEWEYMCRAGSETPWFFGANDAHLGDYAWYSLNSSERTAPTGTTRPNPLGLFDVYGNVEEWCQDLSGLPITSEELSKLAMGIDVRPGERILKGGYYRAMKKSLRSAKRQSYPPTVRLSYLGFRIARTLP